MALVNSFLLQLLVLEKHDMDPRNCSKAQRERGYFYRLVKVDNPEQDVHKTETETVNEVLDCAYEYFGGDAGVLNELTDIEAFKKTTADEGVVKDDEMALELRPDSQAFDVGDFLDTVFVVDMGSIWGEIDLDNIAPMRPSAKVSPIHDCLHSVVTDIRPLHLTELYVEKEEHAAPELFASYLDYTFKVFDAYELINSTIVDIDPAAWDELHLEDEMELERRALSNHLDCTVEMFDLYRRGFGIFMEVNTPDLTKLDLDSEPLPPLDDPAPLLDFSVEVSDMRELMDNVFVDSDPFDWTEFYLDDEVEAIIDAEPMTERCIVVEIFEYTESGELIEDEEENDDDYAEPIGLICPVAKPRVHQVGFGAGKLSAVSELGNSAFITSRPRAYAEFELTDEIQAPDKLLPPSWTPMWTFWAYVLKLTAPFQTFNRLIGQNLNWKM